MGFGGGWDWDLVVGGVGRFEFGLWFCGGYLGFFVLGGVVII